MKIPLQQEVPLANHLNSLYKAPDPVSSESTPRNLVDCILKTVQHYSHSDNLALFAMDAPARALRILGSIKGTNISRADGLVRITPSLMDIIQESEQFLQLPVSPLNDIPVPDLEEESTGRTCMCIPLIGHTSKVIGLITMEQADERLAEEQTQLLQVISALTAISLENSHLLDHSTIDVVTGLHSRSYFNSRLDEEIARLRRAGGMVSVMMIAIDNFRAVCAGQGPAWENKVLQRVAAVIKASIRNDVDIPCRYDNNEFAVIMPETTARGAAVVAERIRRNCGKNRLPEAVNVTVSGGIAAVDSQRVLSGKELLARVAAMLQTAQQNGSNKICIWGLDSDHM